MATWTHQGIADALDAVSDRAVREFEASRQEDLERELTQLRERNRVARLALRSACGSIGHVAARHQHQQFGTYCLICGEGLDQPKPDADSDQEASRHGG